MIRRPPRSTRTDTLFPYTTLFRSVDVVEPQVHEPGLLRILGDEIDRHVGIEPGEVGLDLPETRALPELVRLLGEKAFLVRDEHARAEPFEGRETLVETIIRPPRPIADVAPTAQLPFARPDERSGGTEWCTTVKTKG